ncbi:MAG: AI-2E family transporter [Mariprofundaceae bacterium]|nr:AI-2E family transporter [Mariprofundaceae bacterium]
MHKHLRKISLWWEKQLDDTEFVILITSLLVIFSLLHFMGYILAPLFIAIALAYVLEGVIGILEKLHLPRWAATSIVGISIIWFFLFSLLLIIPLLAEQIAHLIKQTPDFIKNIQITLDKIQNYASWLTPEYLQQAIADNAQKLQEWAGQLVSLSLTSIPAILTLSIYIILVPVLVFFLLKDKHVLLTWSQRFTPKENTLIKKVWGELDTQIGNYIRGKFWETFVVGLVTWFSFWLLDHPYALLLGAITGISVWIPFVGAALVTIPVVLLSFYQWGLTDITLYALIAYFVIQILDGNLLVPLLFSGMVNLHPIAIVVAILFFGSIWGIVGVFIAIPMAALVQSVLNVRRENTAI